MKLLLVPDLHGRKPLIPKEDFDAIVCIGDICSDKQRRKLEKEWMVFLEKNPTKTLSDDEYIVKKIGKRKASNLDKDSLDKGNKMLKFLDSFGKPIFFVPGNWDQSYGKTKIKNMDENIFSYLYTYYDFWLGDKLNPKLVKGVKNLVDCQYKIHEFNGFNFIGYGLSSNTEKLSFRKKTKDISRIKKWKLNRQSQKIISKLENAYNNRNNNIPTIFLTHNVPNGTKIDVLINKKSKLNGKHFGSTVAREFVLKHKPLLCIGGHMHEHFGKVKLGKTTCINVGFGDKKATIIDLHDGKIKKIKFIGKTNV